MDLRKTQLVGYAVNIRMICQAAQDVGHVETVTVVFDHQRRRGTYKKGTNIERQATRSTAETTLKHHGIELAPAFTPDEISFLKDLDFLRPFVDSGLLQLVVSNDEADTELWRINDRLLCTGNASNVSIFGIDSDHLWRSLFRAASVTRPRARSKNSPQSYAVTRLDELRRKWPLTESETWCTAIRGHSDGGSGVPGVTAAGILNAVLDEAADELDAADQWKADLARTTTDDLTPFLSRRHEANAAYSKTLTSEVISSIVAAEQATLAVWSLEEYPTFLKPLPASNTAAAQKLSNGDRKPDRTLDAHRPRERCPPLISTVRLAPHSTLLALADPPLAFADPT